MGEGYQQLMGADEAVAEKGKAVVGLVGAEAEAAGSPIAHS